MGVNIVENEGGRRRVRLLGVVLLFGAFLVGCMAVPAAVFWFAFRDARLVSNAFALGFGVACLSCGVVLGRSLQVPIGKLPRSASGVED